MLKNYIKIALRNLWKNRQYSFINILGLSIGIAAVVLIFIYLKFEWSYDRFHENRDHIYRVAVEENWEGRIGKFNTFLAPVGPALKNDFRQVENFTRVRQPVSQYFYSQNNPYRIDEIHHVDSTFFDIFSFDILSGDPKSALASPYSIVVTRSKAKDIWGREEVLGNTLQSESGETYTVTAVVQDPPINSSIQFDALISFSTLYQDPNMFMGWNGGNQYTTFIQLQEQVDPSQFEDLLDDFIGKYLDESIAITYHLTLEPLPDIHLFYDPGFLFRRILQFGAIALLILIMGSSNFINISLAQSTRRAKETGVRKVMGAEKRQLVFQFLAESVLTTAIAAAVAILLIELVFPTYSEILGQELPRSSLYSTYFILVLIAIAGLVGIAAGSIPAFYLASLSPVKILKNSLLSGHGKGGFRNGLLFVQFFISVLLIFGTLVIYQQQVFMKNKVLGFNKNNILVVNLPTDEMKANNQLIKEEVLNFPFVEGATLCSQIPYRGVEANGYLPEGFDSHKLVHVIHTDSDFLETFDIDIVEGRIFRADMEADRDAYVINEALVNMLQWEDPLGKTIERSGTHEVLGVVKDFHFASMHDKIEPLIIANSGTAGYLGQLALRIDNNAITSGTAIPQIQNAVAEVLPSAPFEYWFLDDAFDTLYRRENIMGQLFLYSTMLALFIAFLGLYSLVAIETEFRTKEIGIRKVLGSSVFGIVRPISKEFLNLVLISSLVAWPTAWFFTHRWLQNFPYRIDLSVWPFLISGLAVIVIALITVSWQAARAASINPIESLRSE
ncbi:ABC transporter permease [Rhodohalobacter sp. 614A]|uniref:ABC transporter permease n=1 Tax=Rhodohalobacter sp. 614A TaxID=2908649 RepID=UPI001F4559FC|nr:ABC transporter permease [Rhodohalobacter sp. 614A]